MTEAWRSIGLYSQAVFLSWWAVAFAVTAGWGVIVFLQPQLATILPPQVAWGVAVFCWFAAPIRAYHRLRLEASEPRPESAVSAPSNFAFNAPGAASPITGNVNNQYNITAQSVTIQPGVPVTVVQAGMDPQAALPAPDAPAQAALPPQPVVAPPFAVGPDPLAAAGNDAPHSQAGVGGDQVGGDIVLEVEQPEPVDGDGA
jgi:hypothetical protein